MLMSNLAASLTDAAFGVLVLACLVIFGDWGDDDRFGW